jgi:hypothetical protein
LPDNFVRVNVKNGIKDIPNVDAIDGWDIGVCNQFEYYQVNVGDNHLGYMGLRNLAGTNKLIDNGTISALINL